MNAEQAYKAGIRAHEVEIKDFSSDGCWLVWVRGWDRPIGQHPNIFRCIQFRYELQKLEDEDI